MRFCCDSVVGMIALLTVHMKTERKDKTLKKSYEQWLKFSACSKIPLCCVIFLKVNSEIYYLTVKVRSVTNKVREALLILVIE